MFLLFVWFWNLAVELIFLDIYMDAHILPVKSVNIFYSKLFKWQEANEEDGYDTGN